MVDAESVAVRETGAAANLVCSGRLEDHDSRVSCWGVPGAETYPPPARFKFGYGSLGEVRCAAEILVDVAGCWPLRLELIFQRYRVKGRREAWAGSRIWPA